MSGERICVDCKHHSRENRYEFGDRCMHPATREVVKEPVRGAPPSIACYRERSQKFTPCAQAGRLWEPKPAPWLTRVFRRCFPHGAPQ